MKRSRLTVWNAIYFTTALIVIGVIVFLTTRSNLYRAVDEDLTRRANFIEKMWDKEPPRKDRPVQRQEHRDGRNANLDPIQRERFELTVLLSQPRISDKNLKLLGPPEEKAFDEGMLRQAVQGSRSMVVRRWKCHRIRILSVPLRRSGSIDGAAQFAANLDDIDEVIVRLRSTLLAIMPITVILVYLLSAWQTRRALRPVQEIAEAAMQLEANDLSGRLPVRGNDEFAYVSSRFNAMLERLDASFQKLAQSRDVQRRLTADASHELKTPLTTIKGRVGMALKNPQTPERYVVHLQSIGRAADRMMAIIGDLLFLARTDEDRLQLLIETCAVIDLVKDAVSQVSPIRRSGIKVDIDPNLEISVDPELMTRVFVNLLTNAVRHTPKEGKIFVRTSVWEHSICIHVIDEGEGIPPDQLPHVFDRFYRVDAARDRSSGGTGLGLPIVRSIVEVHGGQVGIESHLGKGTTVTVMLPLS